ncbi:zinc finger protein 729 [Danaus plexippus plexippus]|uniref:Zinc finger protein 729 n=1 Tax=Danaus plexippus plexippus TaxID=278856 RepID=A0A212EPQ0_DANPL|nr:zinc finger protein 729 [Danaus plexippus plexippus]
MEENDDMFIVVIGNESDQTFPAPMQIKEEVLEESAVEDVEDVINKAKEFGEVVDVKCQTVKEDYDRNVDIQHDFEYEFVDVDFIKSEKDESDEISDEDARTMKTRIKGLKIKRRKLLKPSERRSYIKELKEQFPELQDDEELLVRCLVEIMKTTKPPPPPLDYYVMDGIMLECVICGTHNESIPAAGRHYQEKHGERYLYCYACGANFRSTTNLYKHEKRCEAPHIKLVLRARALSLGRKGRSRPFLPKFDNTEPRRYNCDECSASFSTKYSLQAHQLLHRGLRPYRCPVCPCAYTSSTVLTRHMKKHGSSRFVCAHCDRSFNVKAALVAHLNTHLRMLQYLTFKYPRMSVLKEHMRKVHGMELMTRKMFFKKLPTLSDTQLHQAKVILKHEVHENDYYMSKHT